jgi:hypothetical protein
MRAVHQRRLTCETQVTVYRDGERPQLFRAREVPELQPLFAPPLSAPPPARPSNPTPLPPLPPLPSSPLTPPPRPPLYELALPPAPLPPGQGGTGESEPVEKRDWIGQSGAETGAAGSRGPDRGPFLILLAAAAAAVGLLYMCSTTPRPADLSNVASDGNSSTDGAWPDVTADDVANSTSRYLVSDTNVRARPTARSAIVAKLLRGTEIRGLPVPSHNGRHGWFRITVGPNRGYFVAASTNLSKQPRPLLVHQHRYRRSRYHGGAREQ